MLKIKHGGLLFCSLIFLWLTLGCDSSGGNSNTIFDNNATNFSQTAPPQGTGNGPRISAIAFSPLSGALTVDIGDPDQIINMTAIPPGGIFALSNINGGGTGGTFILGPGANQLTFTASSTTAIGVATVDVTYTPLDGNFPSTATYIVNVVFTVLQATLTFNPTSPQSVTTGDPDLVVTATGSPAGGMLSLSNINAGGTGGTFNLGPAGNQFTFTSSATTTAGTATCDVTYTPPVPDLPVTVTYTVNVAEPLGGSFSNTTPISTTAATTTSPITVPLSATVTEVRVLVDITAVFIGELNVSVVSPSSTSLLLMDLTSNPSASSTFEGIFDDGASAVATVPVTGFPSFLPFGGSLSTFIGEPISGTWNLVVVDTTVTSDPKTINEWAIAFNGDTSIF